MATVALALYLVGLVVLFGVRSWIQRRRTGSSGFKGISGAPGSDEWWGGVTFIAAMVLGLVTYGGFGSVRNPIFSAMVVAQAGEAAIVGLR